MAIIKFKRWSVPAPPPVIAYGYRVGIGSDPCANRDQQVLVWSTANVFGTGIQLWLNRALTTPAGSGRVTVFTGLAGTTYDEGLIYNISNGLVGTSTNVYC